MTLEERLIAAVEAATVLDVAGPGRPGRAEMDSWGPDRTIDASLIRDVLLGRKAPKADPHGIRLRGVRISGPLDLYNVQSDLDLSLSDCLIEGGVILSRGRLRVVSFIGCVLLLGNAETCLDGEQLAAAALDLQNSTFEASARGSAIDLRGAQIDGLLNLSGAQLNGQNTDGDSLIGDGSTVNGDMFLGPSGQSAFTAVGAIRLAGAHIHGSLHLSGAQLNGQDTHGNSLIGDGLTVERGMYLRARAKWRFSAAGAIRLVGAHISGQLNLSGAQLNGHDPYGNSLFGDRLTIDGAMFLNTSGESPFTTVGAIRLVGATIHGQLQVSGAQLNGCDKDGNSLVGDRLSVDGSMFFRPSGGSVLTAAGAIRLPGAHIHNQLGFEGAQLNGHDAKGNSLMGDALIVDGSMFLGTGSESGFAAAGAVRLLGAHIQGQLAFSGAQLNGYDADGDSLIGDMLTVGEMFLGTSGKAGFTSSGAIRLLGAHIRGQLEASGAKLNGTDGDGDSLIGAGLTVDGDMFLGTRVGSEFTSEGAVQLVRAQIAGQLWVQLSSLGGAGEVALSLAGASVGELSLVLSKSLDREGQVDLRDATYARLSQLDDLDQWLALLRHHTATYTPQAYQQLAAVHRAAGHERDARRILIAQQDDHRRLVVRAANGANRRTRSRFWARRAWLWVQKVAIGYGYRTWPAFVGVLVLAALGAGLGIAAGHTHAGTTKQFAAYRPASAVRKADHRCSTVEQASFGVRVPFLSNLGAGDCVLNTASVPGEVYSFAIWTDQALAWAAATLAVAGYTGLVRRT